MLLRSTALASALFIAAVYGGICNDKRTDCANWARDGECSGENAKYMAEICPLSCGTCTHACNENPEFMIRNCPVTCEACKSVCKDIANDCPGWTADGECYKNPGFMYKECPGSCGVCEGLKCADTNATQCKIWADAGECLNNPLAVMKE